MKNWRQLLVNERGMALALALIIMVIMTALAVGLAAMGGVESRISASQSAGSRARLLAESGIEYAFLSLAASDFTTKLLAGSTLIPAGTTLPGLTAASGTFGVTIRNDINAGDALLTGAGALDTGSATLDLNGIVVLTSTGTVDGATRIVVAVVQRGNLNINAALTLPGAQADTTTDSPCQNSGLPAESVAQLLHRRPGLAANRHHHAKRTEYPQAWGRHGLHHGDDGGERVQRHLPARLRPGPEPEHGDADHGPQHDRRRHDPDPGGHPEVHDQSGREPRDPDSSRAPKHASTRPRAATTASRRGSA